MREKTLKELQKSRRGFLKSIGLATATLALPSCLRAEAKPKQRPNILWLISEDTSPDMACYGNPIVKTPNFDRLASQGIRFTNAFATGPVCSASRSAFMTGMYQTTIGCHHHRSHRRDNYQLPEPVKVISEYFRQDGYYTSNLGKTDFNFKADKPFDGKDWSGRKPGQPFFAVHNFGLTHRKFKRDPENPIDPDKVKAPPYYPDHPIMRRDWADYLESLQVLDRQVGEVLKQLDDEGLSDNTIVFYFGDHGRPHLWDKQWLYEGGIRVPLMVRWPKHFKAGTVCDDLVSMIDFAPTCLTLAGIEAPSHIQGWDFLGKQDKRREFIFAARDRCDGTVDRIRCVRTKRYKYIRNFMPERPYMQFNSYKTHSYPTVALMQVLHKQGKLTPAQARFVAPTKPREEWYDLQVDPFELNNLADQADPPGILDKLRKRLDQWMVETDDKGRFPEEPGEVEFWQKQMAQAHKTNTKRKGLTENFTSEEHLIWWEKQITK
jgi:N-sulfoglucosamine sulfohydrolase